MKKCISDIITLLVLMVCLAFSASALGKEGKCGDNVFWKFDDTTGKLEITGEGDMWDYNDYNRSPFYQEDCIKTLLIENGITKVGVESFYRCANLKTVTISDSVVTIAPLSFSDCDKLLSVKIPDSVKTIGVKAFEGCEKLADVTIEYGVTKIENHAFTGCVSLTNVNLPDSIESIGDYAFAGCEELKNISLPSDLERIGEKTFNYCCSLESINIPNNVKTIGMAAFCTCSSLKSVKLPPCVTYLDKYAFMSCENLTEIYIPASVNYIGFAVFDACYNLSDVFYDGDEKQWKEITIEKCNDPLINATIHLRVEATDLNSGIVIQYYTGTFNGEKPDVVINEKTTDSNFVIEEAFSKYKAYDITFKINNVAVQPTGNVTVKIPVPAEFNHNVISVYYVDAYGNKTKLNSSYENGYIIFITDHFSEYVLVDESSKIAPSDDCSCNCHQSGFMGFIWKILRIFYKLFKINPVCACGAAHY